MNRRVAFFGGEASDPQFHSGLTTQNEPKHLEDASPYSIFILSQVAIHLATIDRVYQGFLAFPFLEPPKVAASRETTSTLQLLKGASSDA